MMMSMLVSVLSYLWTLIVLWLSIFVAPFHNAEMLWVIVPIYLNWLFAEIFQEKKKTSLGNAISNAAIILWASVDWSRTSVRFYGEGLITGWDLAGKILISLIVLSYGGWIVYDGIKGKPVTHYLGRIRVVSYIALMLTPMVYNTIALSIHMILSIVLFFPVFYYLIEFIDNMTPDPVSIEEMQGDGQPGNTGNFDLEKM